MSNPDTPGRPFVTTTTVSLHLDSLAFSPRALFGRSGVRDHVVSVFDCPAVSSLTPSLCARVLAAGQVIFGVTFVVVGQDGESAGWVPLVG